MPYVETHEAQIPAAVRWTVPAQHQGQMVEVAYGHFGRDEAGPGDPYKRVTDQAITGAARRSGDGVTFYKLSKAS